MLIIQLDQRQLSASALPRSSLSLISVVHSANLPISH